MLFVSKSVLYNSNALIIQSNMKTLTTCGSANGTKQRHIMLRLNFIHDNIAQFATSL